MGARDSGTSANANRSATEPTTGRLPNRAMSEPAIVIEPRAPTATPSSASPSNPSLRESFSLTAGMRTTHVATPTPFRKKIANTANRADLTVRAGTVPSTKRTFP